jgi:predicted ATP-dependent endonuclease of OLD family
LPQILRKYMLFTFKNIGIVREASVKLDGLTVIGGENDTGKSTVGKLLFAIVKGISRYEQDVAEAREDKINAALKKLQTNFGFEISSSIISGLSNLPPEAKSEIFLNEEIERFRKRKENKKIEEKFIETIEDFKNSLPFRDLLGKIIKKGLKRVLHSEFYSEITPRFSPNIVSEIDFSTEKNAFFKAEIKKDEIDSVQFEGKLFEDVTFIETPIVLQLYSVLNHADTLLELESDNKANRLDSISRPKVSLHLKDLISKVESVQYSQKSDFDSKNSDFDSDFIKKIAKIVGGEFVFDNNRRDFIFQKNNGANVRAANTASGIKSFGLIQLLLEARFLDSKSLLVLDEPETHLHPKWQVEYARLIVELVKNDIPVLCTSHSPYLIQALKVFSGAAGISEKTNFYLAEREENEHRTAIISDVTNNLNRLFQKLAEPLRNLVWQ